MVNKITLEDWTDNYVSGLIRANNSSPDYKLIIVGIGKTTRLMRLRNNFQLLDVPAKSAIAEAYRNSKKRMIILDNEVLTNNNHRVL